MRFAALSLVFLALVCGRALAQPPPFFALERPECVGFKDGRIDCLARTREGTFAWIFHDGRKWSRPQIFAGKFAAGASCVVRGPFGMNCFAVRADGSLWHIAMNGGRWRQWRPLGGRLAIGRPSCVAPVRNQIICHARSATGSLAIKAWLGDTTWQAWREAGQRLNSEPSCTKLGFERVACFWRRDDALLSGMFPEDAGPSSAVLTVPRETAPPSCASLSGDKVVCLSALPNGQLVEWRGDAVLGGVGVDGVKTRPSVGARDPRCLARSGRVHCTYLTTVGALVAMEAVAQGWTAPVQVAQQAFAGQCALFEGGRIACPYLTRQGELRVTFREDSSSSAPALALSALPAILEKPVTASSAVAPTAQPPAALASVSIREPLGVWRVFEPKTGLHCQVTLFDAPARPYRSLTRDPDCDAMTSIRGVARWSAENDGIFLRDSRGRVYFRFVEAGPTALRAKWRRNDFIMMARDLRAFAAAPKAAPKAAPEALAAMVEPSGPKSGIAGVWQVKGPGKRSCILRLSIDAETASTLARPDGCQGSLAKVDGWSVRRGALVLERNGDPLARFVEGRGVTWHGRFEGGRRSMTMVKQ